MEKTLNSEETKQKVLIILCQWNARQKDPADTLLKIWDLIFDDLIELWENPTSWRGIEI